MGTCRLRPRSLLGGVITVGMGWGVYRKGMGPSNAYVWEATGGGIIEEDPHICCKVSYSLLPTLPSPFIGKPDSTHRWQCHPLQQPNAAM